MKRYLFVFAIILVTTCAFGTDQIIQYNEKMVGANHPTLADTLNRGFLIEHNADGTHKDNVANLALSDNLVTPIKLYSISGTPDNTTFYRGDGMWISPSVSFQSQIDLKQAADTDLTVLATPTAWRLFYSNGSQAITELSLGADNTYLRSNGSSSAPTWSAVSGGSGTVTSLDNTTMDNTIIGGTTPAAGAFSSLSRGAVSDAEFEYLDNTTSNIQAQLDTKAPLNSPEFVGAGTSTGEWTSTQYNSTAVDGEHFINVGNTTHKADPAYGDCEYYFPTNSWMCWDNTQWASPVVQGTTELPWDNITSRPTINSVTITGAVLDNVSNYPTFNQNTTGAAAKVPSGASPTVDAEGKIGIDTSGDQVVYYGGAERVLTYQFTKDFVINGYTASHDNVVRWKAHPSQTLTQLDCMTGGTDNVTVTLYECDANNANCATTGLVAAATSSGAADTSASNGTIDADDWVRVSLSSLQGTATSVACTVRYVITRQ